jgi:hypothetical protein
MRWSHWLALAALLLGGVPSHGHLFEGGKMAVE